MRRPLLLALLLLAAALPAAVQGAPTPGDAAIAKATALQSQWGRCPTARPAARLLAQALVATKPVPRVRRARAALRAWTAVVQECSVPVAMPQVTP